MAHSPDAVTIVQWRPAMDLQALCRVGRIPYHVINSRYPLFISTGGLPQVRCGAVALGPQSFEWIQKRFHLDSHLSDRDAAVQTAMLELVRSRLGAVVTWCTVARSGGGGDRSPARTPDSTQMIWPLRWILPAALTQLSLKHSEHLGWRDEGDVRAAATAGYTALATLLSHSSGPFFFGSTSSSLDAAVFGHLDAVRTLVAGTWVKASAPSLVAFYETFRARMFEGRGHDQPTADVISDSSSGSGQASLPLSASSASSSSSSSASYASTAAAATALVFNGASAPSATTAPALLPAAAHSSTSSSTSALAHSGTSTSALAHSGTYGAVGPSELLRSVTGCDNAFAAASAAVEARWLRHQKAAAASVTAHRHAAQTREAVAGQAVGVVRSAAEVEVGTVPSAGRSRSQSTAASLSAASTSSALSASAAGGSNDNASLAPMAATLTISAATPTLTMFGVDAATLDAGERDAAVSSFTVVKDAAITVGILGTGAAIVLLASSRSAKWM